MGKAKHIKNLRPRLHQELSKGFKVWYEMGLLPILEWPKKALLSCSYLRITRG